MGNVELGRKLLEKCMADTIRHYEGDMSAREHVEYLFGSEELGVLRSPSMYLGAMIATIEHPVKFVKTFGYSIGRFFELM